MLRIGGRSIPARAQPPTESPTPSGEGDPVSRRIEKLRAGLGLDREEFAALVGVKAITVLRWETGTSKPSAAAALRLTALGMGELAAADTKAASTPRLSLAPEADLRAAVVSHLVVDGSNLRFEPASYVTNGPADQLRFFHELFELQAAGGEGRDRVAWTRRLSCISEVEGTTTAQAQLERPRPTARAWNGNYGTHGWHRYVGRFPPHLVRALLNHFGATPDELVCDPFAGSGTTLVEARLLGLNAVGADLCPLSCTMSRAKAQFPVSTESLHLRFEQLSHAYVQLESQFRSGASALEHAAIFARSGNAIPPFPNAEKWFTPEALLGVSIAVELISGLKDYERDFFSTALSAEMRSIGNVDVDVVRAEYRKEPRQNVEVLKLWRRRVNKMLRTIDMASTSHDDLLGDATAIEVFEGDARELPIVPGTVSYVVTSPPYGVESLSYLRTHLLSYRSLQPIFGHDPYHNNAQVIGSEYLPAGADRAGNEAAPCSPTFRAFFGREFEGDQRRVAMMEKFFDDLVSIADRFVTWVRPGGRIAFVIGNKRLGTAVIPTDQIVREIFESRGLTFDRAIEHKLKTNNSNSEVPWQERIIQQEAALLFSRH